MSSLETVCLVIGIVIGMIIQKNVIPGMKAWMIEYRKRKDISGNVLLDKIERYLFDHYERKGYVDQDDVLAMSQHVEYWDYAHEAGTHVVWVGNREGYTITVYGSVPGAIYELKGTWTPPQDLIEKNYRYVPRFELATKC